MAFLPRNLRNAIGRWGAALILVGKRHNTTSLKSRQYGTGRNWALSWHLSTLISGLRAANWTLGRSHVKLKRFLSLAVAVL